MNLTAGQIREAAHKVAADRPEIPFNVHGPLRLVLDAAEAHAANLQRWESDEFGEQIASTLHEDDAENWNGPHDPPEWARLPEWAQEVYRRKADRIIALIKGES